MDIMDIGGENVEKLQQLAIMEEEDEEGMSVPNWLIDVLKWITRMEMANSSLSFSCKLFNRLCWQKLHGNVKPHFVPDLEFCYKKNNFGHIWGILKDQRILRHHVQIPNWPGSSFLTHPQVIPIAAIAPPEYILGFKRIKIHYLDTRVVEFFKNIALDEIILSMDEWPKNDEEIGLMSNLLTILGRNIYRFDICEYSAVSRFGRFWRPCRRNDFPTCFLNLNRQFPTFIDQVAHLSVAFICDLDLDTLFNWLMKPLTHGRQKFLLYGIKGPRELKFRFINRIKEEFTHSTKRTNFLVVLDASHPNAYDQFRLENEQTGEVLDSYCQSSCVIKFERNYLARYPKGEEHWKEGSVVKYKTHIQLEIYDIDE